MKKNLLRVMLTCALFYSGCGGREANPIPSYMPGDDRRSCESLKVEMAQIQADISRKLPKSKKAGYNTACFVGGLLVIAPFFFMDLKNADRTEIEALRQRFNHLAIIASDKECTVVTDRSKVGQTELGEEPTVKVDNSPRIISGYKVKQDASGKIVVDKDGNFVLVPIYEDEQKKDK